MDFNFKSSHQLPRSSFLSPLRNQYWCGSYEKRIRTSLLQGFALVALGLLAAATAAPLIT